MLKTTEDEIAEAVRRFWRARPAGTQAAEHPRAFIDLIVEDLRQEGWTDIGSTRQKTTVGGYFRPGKSWDIVCWQGRRPRIAVEFKSQVGSYSNNENNRYEEALGNALDLRARYGGAIGLGFVYVICDEAASRRPTRSAGIADLDPVFQGTSHVTRKSIFAERVMTYRLRDGHLYDAAAVLIVRADGTYEHPEDGRFGLLEIASALSSGRHPE